MTTKNKIYPTTKDSLPTGSAYVDQVRDEQGLGSARGVTESHEAAIHNPHGYELNCIALGYHLAPNEVVGCTATEADEACRTGILVRVR